MTTVPLSEAENRLPELVDSVDRTHDRVLITRNGRETALLMSVRDYESLEATLELATDPAAQGRLREARAEIDAGEMVDSADLAALLESKRTAR